jgi:CubicO group peptidase (beta-lactamase class C family)
MHRLHYIFLTLVFFAGWGTAPISGVSAQAPHRVFRFDLEEETVDMIALMKASNTPAVSMAIDNGQLDSSFTAALPGAAALNTETLFSAGAASALPVCIAVLQLVERGAFDLNAPINSYLHRGKLADGESVTLHDVLLMKPRMGSGYKPDGYFAGTALPELADIAEGFRFKGIRKLNKGTEYGGWVLLQLVLEQHYKEPLDAIIQREVFRPLCLGNLFYATALNPSQLKRAAMGHMKSGEAVQGGYKRYVAQSDAGLWTNAADYAKLVRALLDINQGKEGSILLPETVEMAFAERYGHRSLLSHMSESGHPYWGGNSKGYYFTMQAHFAEDWVAVVAMNRDLNWRLGSPVVWQLGMLGKQWRSEGRLGIILQPDDTDEALITELEHKAFVEGVKTERLNAEGGLPKAISATPAFVYQSPAGRAIYGGKHNDLEAITKFVRLNQATPRKFAADERTNILAFHRGRQMIVMPLKLTAPTGTEAPAELPLIIEEVLHDQLVLKTSFEQTETVSLNAQDRRVYLDVHSYRTGDGAYKLTYALFSQFNCHTPVFTNYGEPVSVNSDGRGLDQLTTRISADVTKMMQPGLGLIPANFATTTPVMDWADLGWALDQAVATKQVSTAFTEPVAVAGTYSANLTEKDAPGMFFSFPSPLDRYSGEVRELVADFNFSEAGTVVSGQVDLPVASISTTSGSLDIYVLGDILKSGKYPTASLTFESVSLPGSWQVNEPVTVIIPAELILRGKTHTIQVNAVFTPQADGDLAIAADFGIDFKKVFGRNGPDGPEDIRHQLGFTARFGVQQLTGKLDDGVKG